MRRCLLIVALAGLTFVAQAASTLRVGNQVLTAGDSVVRVTELLGKPSRKSRPSRSRSSNSHRRGGRLRVAEAAAAGGERWLYRRGDHVTTVTIVDDKVVDIDDRRD